ncbi:hypothetical protein UlMin_012771 [Ulmus minor]
MAFNPRVFLEISIDGRCAGIIEIELFANTIPYIVENLCAICTSYKDIRRLLGMPLHYKGSTFFRVTKGYIYQGGDITAKNGISDKSIYNDTFNDENFIKKHTSPSVCFNGNDIITGHIVEGMDGVKTINKVGSDFGRTSNEVVIVDYGQVS